MMYITRKSALSLLYFILIIFGLLGCQNDEYKKIDNLVNIDKVHHYDYAVIKYGESPVLMIGGKITLKESLKNIYIQLNYDYARIECEAIDQFKPYANLNVTAEQKEQSIFISDFLMKICPENDANSEHCITNLKDFKENIRNNMHCHIIFGGMTKPKIIISNQFEISNEQILQAEKYMPK